MAGTVTLESARLFTLPFDSDQYRVLYCLCLLPIRLLAGTIALQSARWASLTSLPFAAGLTWIVLQGISPTVDQWICIVDGIMVTVAGVSLCLAAPFSEHKNLLGTLAVLWLLLGLFDFGYVLQPYGRWRDLNDTLLPVMVIGAFGWISLTARSSRQGQAQVGTRSL